MKRMQSVIMMIVFVALLSGCAATREAKSVEASGFLAEYKSLLRPGERGEEVLLVYRKPDVNWASYNKILLEPVTLWHSPDEQYSPEQQEDLQKLADSFFDLLVQKLSTNYQMVDKPLPDTMRFQVALVHGEEASTGLSFTSKVIPQLRMLQGAWTFYSDRPVFTGGITVEFKIKNARTGELLAAGADKRVGGQKLFDKNVFNSWGDVKNALTYWADFAQYRLCVFSKKGECAEPKA